MRLRFRARHGGAIDQARVADPVRRRRMDLVRIWEHAGNAPPMLELGEILLHSEMPFHDITDTLKVRVVRPVVTKSSQLHSAGSTRPVFFAIQILHEKTAR